ncbi:LAQU0S09e03312g1_1 [Lachancea quebecensis]|uniref:peptidylprolyl isomerase n=1 Tax=Lachancea quebecensis TaxID=1654605 RepID=A0A0P1KUG2_9SACH|nr:LAQU0S09e03312g1_1 [Lachancea quebecensis]
MLVNYVLWVLSALLCFTKAANIDNAKLYAPNPPVTHRAFFTIEYFNNATGKIEETDLTIELYGTVVPKTVDNFVKLAKGVTAVMKGKDEKKDRFTLGYKDTLFHRVISNFMIQGGDVLPNVGPFNIHGGTFFDDENFDLKHDRPGRLSMANINKPNTNASQFFIVTSIEALEDLDNKHVVFGQVVAGLEDLIEKVQYVETTEGDYKPKHDVKLKYSIVEDLQIANQEQLHDKYLEDLTAFQNGDRTKGLTMATTFKQGVKEESIMRELKYEDLHHPLVKVVFGMVLIGAIYVISKNRKRIFNKTTNIVSMRHE